MAMLHKQSANRHIPAEALIPPRHPGAEAGEGA